MIAGRELVVAKYPAISTAVTQLYRNYTIRKYIFHANPNILSNIWTLCIIASNTMRCNVQWCENKRWLLYVNILTNELTSFLANRYRLQYAPCMIFHHQWTQFNASGDRLNKSYHVTIQIYPKSNTKIKISVIHILRCTGSISLFEISKVICLIFSGWVQFCRETIYITAC